MFRLGSSKVVPYALRTISSTCTRIGSLIKSESFCSDAKKQNDIKIVKTLNSKIESMHFIHKPMPLPSGLPFTIHDDPCKSYITLKRELDGEKIGVEIFSMGLQSQSFKLHVKTFKEHGQKELKLCVRVNCVDNYNIEIENIEVKVQESLSWQIWGWQLDNDLVEAYAEFLEIRGINKSYAAFLHDLAIRKSTRYSISNLKEMTKFINE